MLKSPLIEKLLKKDYEVLLMTEAIDEYLFQNGALTKYGEYEFVNVAKESLELEDDEETDEEAEDGADKVCDYLKEVLGSKITRCAPTNRLTDSPSALTSPKWGWTGNMERLAKAQALANPDHKEMYKFYKGQKILEINPKHPVIIELKNRITAGPDAISKDVANLMYETALLSSGYEIDDLPSFSQRIQNVLRLSLGLEPIVVEETPIKEAEDTDAADFDLDVDNMEL